MEFILEVDKEMRTMLDSMVREMGESKMTIEELARRNPTAAEQLKKAAEASVLARMEAQAQAALDAVDAVGPFALPPTDRDLWVKSGEVAQRLQKIVLEAGPTPAKPGMVTAAHGTASQLLTMINILMQQQGLPPLVAPPMAPLPQVAPAAPAPPPPSQLALQALAQQLAGALMQQQKPPPQQQQQGLPPHHHQQQQQPQQATSQQQTPHQYILTRLYTGEQCKEDGLRFSTRQELAAHEAWLDKVHQLAAAAKAKGKTGVESLRSRAWFGTVAEWAKEKRPSQRVVALAARINQLGGGDGYAAQGGAGGASGAGGGGGEDLAHCVPMDDSHSTCMLCGEPFDQFWEGGRAQWMYRNAAPVKVINNECVHVPQPSAETGETVLVHWLCFEASDSKEAAKMLLRRRQSLQSVNSEDIELPDEE